MGVLGLTSFLECQMLLYLIIVKHNPSKLLDGLILQLNNYVTIRYIKNIQEILIKKIELINNIIQFSQVNLIACKFYSILFKFDILCILM